MAIINNRLINQCSIFTVVILLSLSETAFSQHFYFQSQRKRETTSFKLVKNLVIIPLFINNKGPFNFILDTGVGIFLITEPDFIEQLDPDKRRAIRIHGIGEGE